MPRSVFGVRVRVRFVHSPLRRVKGMEPGVGDSLDQVILFCRGWGCRCGVGVD